MYLFKRLNLRQSCIFVHQNVPAADAENKMIEERQMFVETLDEMAKASADQENIASIQTFSQVIDFDSEEHVSHVIMIEFFINTLVRNT
jgi:glutamate mutase epsilon subunit